MASCISACPKKCCPPKPEPPPCIDTRSPVHQQISAIRDASSRRGPNGLRDLGRMFCLYDDVNGDCGPNRVITCGEMKRGLRDFGVRLTDDLFDKLCKYLDHNGDGQIVLGDLFELIRPTLSKARADLIDDVYRRIDTDNDGCITTADVLEAFNHEKHPKFLNGEWTKEQVVKTFIDDFRYPGAYEQAVEGNVCEKISKQELVDYYSGISTVIDKDVYFDYMIRNNWKL